MAFFSMIKVLFICTTSLSLLLTTPASGKGSNYLLGNENLNNGETLEEGNYKLTMGKTCNLVLSRSGTEIWSSKTQFGGHGCFLTLQRNGKLKITAADSGKEVWSRGPNGQNGNYILVLQRDPDVIIYGPSAWSATKSTYGSDDVVVATALNGTTGVSGEEQNNVREMGKIMEVIGDE